MESPQIVDRQRRQVKLALHWSRCLLRLIIWSSGRISVNNVHHQRSNSTSGKPTFEPMKTTICDKVRDEIVNIIFGFLGASFNRFWDVKWQQR
jgi:hypothetical protein